MRVVRQSDGCPEGHIWDKKKKKCVKPTDPKVQVMSSELYDLRYKKNTPKPKGKTTTSTVDGVVFSCPANDTFVYCNKKIPNASMLSGIDITTPDWQTCQRKCWNHGEACQSWAFNKSGACKYGTSRDYSKFAYATGWMAGPRYDPDSRSGYGRYSDENNNNSLDDDDIEPVQYLPQTPPPKVFGKWQLILGGLILVCSVLMFGVVAAVSMK